MAFAWLFDLVRSLLDLTRVVIELLWERKREEYVPRHLAPRRGGSAHRKSR